MKTLITALVLAAGIITVAATAENSAAPASVATTELFPPASSPPANAQVKPDDIKSVGEAVPAGPSVRQIIQSEYTFHYKSQSADRESKEVRPEVMASASFTPIREAEPAAVFSMMPSPFSYNAPNHPTTWYAAVSFPFDFDRHHRS